MKLSANQILLVLATLLLPAGIALAEDIDIYQANNAAAQSNLLLVIDNSGSWNAAATTASADSTKNCSTSGPDPILHSTLANSAGGVETCGIWKAVDAIGKTDALLGKIRMGLMLFSQGSVQGGTFQYPAATAPIPNALPLMDAAGITAMKTALTGLQSSGRSNNTANGTDVGGAMQEAWAFYTGNRGISGTTYPGINASVCGKNFVIFIGISRTSSSPGDFNANQVKLALAGAGATAAQQTYINWSVNNNYSRSNNYWGDEWTRFSKQNNAITTYTITLADENNPNRHYERFMKSMADASGGKAFVVNVNNMDAFVQALLAIFNEVQAVNSVFASASLPISANAQGTFLNQVYFGMFRPDSAGLPRWVGNLKQYRFALDARVDPVNPKLYLADARANDPATGLPYSALSSAGTGFFSPNAVSHWTSKNIAAAPDNIDPTGNLAVNGGISGGFFIFNPQSTGEGFDLPDGEIVEKGGVAQRLRLENLVNNYALAPGVGNPRRLYTCTTGRVNCIANSPLSDTPFSPSNADLLAHPALGAGVASTPISALTRVEAVASVTLLTPMNPALANGQTVTITGPMAHVGYTGIKLAGGPPTATTFTYPVTVLPPLTAIGTSYTAAAPAVTRGINTIIRSSRSEATINYTNSGVQDYVAGDSVSIKDTTGYNTGAVLVQAGTTATTVIINISALISPPTRSTPNLGTASVGGASRNIAGLARDDPSTTPPFAATVVIDLTTNRDNSFIVGQTLAIRGVPEAGYSGDWIITSVGSACKNGGHVNRRLCVSIPTLPQNQVGGSISLSTASVNITEITRASSCTGDTPTQIALATATTATGHTFSTRDTVSIGRGDAVRDLYTGTVVLASTTPGTNTFTYNVTTDVPCSDASSDKTAAAGSADATTLINWVRGQDNLGDELGPGSSITNVRASIHGDVLHSRPAVVNYGSATGVVIYYGANDGVFRAVNGNQSGAINGVPPGGELWGFVASEFLSKLMRQHLNTPVLKLGSGLVGNRFLDQRPKDYFFDGNVGVYTSDTQKIIYLTARRGGRLIYALDVTAPANPKFLWKKTPADEGFVELGQTWSTPKVAKVKGHANPVLIFGAGYDPAEDGEPPSDRSMGRGIYILDAFTGAKLWKAAGPGFFNQCTGGPSGDCELAMAYPIPSDVALLDRDGDSYIDRVYVPDLGGNVWRIDLEPTAGNTPAHWQASKFASVGGDPLSTDTRRKIFFPPDVVPTRDFDALLFATGDREHPTRAHQAAKTLNRFYMLKDTRVGNDACIGSCRVIRDHTSSLACVAATPPKTPASCTEAVPEDLFNASVVLPTVASSAPAVAGSAYNHSGNGFYLNLLNAVAHQQADGSVRYGPEIESGEKAVNAPTTIGGNTFFGTNTPIAPSAAVCQADLGTARGYAVNFVTGVPNFAVFDGGGLPPSPVAGTVMVDGQKVPFIIGGVPPPGSAPLGSRSHSSLEGSSGVGVSATATRTRAYWYRDLGNR